MPRPEFIPRNRAEQAPSSSEPSQWDSLKEVKFAGATNVAKPAEEEFVLNDDDFSLGPSSWNTQNKPAKPAEEEFVLNDDDLKVDFSSWHKQDRPTKPTTMNNPSANAAKQKVLEQYDKVADKVLSNTRGYLSQAPGRYDKVRKDLLGASESAEEEIRKGREAINKMSDQQLAQPTTTPAPSQKRSFGFFRRSK